MAKNAKITVHPSFEIGEISPRLFGAFLEPSRRQRVHGIMYNPNHPEADEQGFRKDVMNALKEANLPCVRLPGGNFISCWDWKDSIGPIEQRKAHLDLAWIRYYTNDVGHDEYLQWAEKTGFEPLYTINLGTGDINDAIKIIEYTNHPGGTYWSDLRIKYGHEKPYGVKVWYLGNEMDGPWQLGSWEKKPREFGILTHEVSKAMKFVDGSIETVACVSSSPFIAHYPQWDMEVLEQCYETVDYISLHHYHSAPIGDIGALLGGSEAFEDYIRTEIALCDFMKTKLRSTKTMMLSFDEYGSNYGVSKPLHYGRNGNVFLSEEFAKLNDPDREYIYSEPDKFAGRTFNENNPEILEALASASVMLTLVRHADRIKIGCMTRGLEAIVAVDKDNVWKTASSYPYEDLINYARGTSLMPQIECETYDIPGYALSDFTQYDSRTNVKYLEAAAASCDDELTVFVINRDWNDDADFTLDVSGFKGYEFVDHTEMYSDDLNAYSQVNDPQVYPKKAVGAEVKDGILTVTLKKLSWNVFRFKK